MLPSYTTRAWRPRQDSHPDLDLRRVASCLLDDGNDVWLPRQESDLVLLVQSKACEPLHYEAMVDPGGVGPPSLGSGPSSLPLTYGSVGFGASSWA